VKIGWIDADCPAPWHLVSVWSITGPFDVAPQGRRADAEKYTPDREIEAKNFHWNLPSHAFLLLPLTI
jgi:hypothetical protein